MSHRRSSIQKSNGASPPPSLNCAPPVKVPGLIPGHLELNNYVYAILVIEGHPCECRLIHRSWIEPTTGKPPPIGKSRQPDAAPRQATVLPAVVRRWIQCTQLYSASCQALHRRSNELLHASNRSRRSKLGLVEERRESSSMRLLVGPIQTTTVHEIRAWWCYKMPVVIEWHPWECTLGSSSSLPTLERSWSTNPRGTDLQPADQCGGRFALETTLT